jgi:hypothetical protein
VTQGTPKYWRVLLVWAVVLTLLYTFQQYFTN